MGSQVCASNELEDAFSNVSNVGSPFYRPFDMGDCGLLPTSVDT